MKTALVFLCLAVAITYAYEKWVDNPILFPNLSIPQKTDSYTLQTFCVHTSNSIFIFRDTCSESKCAACKYFFGNEGPAKFDCAGQCGLCALCPYNPSVKDCDIYCKDGIAACTETCTKGKVICMNCSKACGL